MGFLLMNEITAPRIVLLGSVFVVFDTNKHRERRDIISLCRLRFLPRVIFAGVRGQIRPGGAQRPRRPYCPGQSAADPRRADPAPQQEPSRLAWNSSDRTI